MLVNAYGTSARSRPGRARSTRYSNERPNNLSGRCMYERTYYTAGRRACDVHNYSNIPQQQRAFIPNSSKCAHNAASLHVESRLTV